MVARMLSVGLAIGLANLVSLGIAPLSAAQAAAPVWSAYNSPGKRPQFRPWQRTEHVAPAARWRPSSPATQWRAMPGGDSRRVLSDTRAHSQRIFNPPHYDMNARYAAPITAQQQPATRFRPDRRQPTFDDRAMRDDLPAATSGQELQSQFRPADNRRKPTYEQMQAASRSPARAYGAPPAAYGAPMFAAPPPVFAGYWPAW